MSEESSGDDWLESQPVEFRSRYETPNKMRKVVHEIGSYGKSSSIHSNPHDNHEEYDHFDVTCSAVFEEIPKKITDTLLEHGTLSYPDRGLGQSVGRRKLYQLLRGKLLEYKWGDAALVMEGLAGETVVREKQLADVFWKVGNEVIYNHPAGANEPEYALAQKKAMRLLGQQTSPVHVLYEYIMFLMVKKDFQTARDALTFFKSSFKTHGLTKFVLEAEVQRWTPILEGYLGLLDYITWKQTPHASQTAFVLSDDDVEHSQRTMTAERALEHFKVVFRSPGIWDSFVCKNTELLEDMSCVAVAEECLRNYSLTNPENPNAHKYLYQFLVRHPETEENEHSRMETLSNLHEIAPSDALMIELHRLRMDAAIKMAGKSSEFTTMAELAIEILMDFLDYASCVKNEKAWIILESSLKTTQSLLSDSSQSFSSILDVIWYVPKRNTWWPKYHFTVFRAKEALQINSALAQAKSSVASIFIGKDCEFCKFVNCNSDLL